MIDLNKLKQLIDDTLDKETKEDILKFIDENLPSEDEYREAWDECFREGNFPGKELVYARIRYYMPEDVKKVMMERARPHGLIQEFAISYFEDRDAGATESQAVYHALREWDI